MVFEEREIGLSRGKVKYMKGGTGAPLLYFHSAGGMRVSAALETLAATHTIYMPFAPGFDGTEPIAGISDCPDLAEFYGEFADKVIGAQCDVLGHSFGGRIAIWFAATFPEKVRLLVLEAPSGFRPAGSAPMRTDPSALIAHPERATREKSPEAMAANGKAAHRYHKSLDNEERLIAQLGKIGAITLILHGTKDGMVPEEGALFLKSRIRTSHLIYVYDAAHAIEVDQPELFATVTGDFLTRGQGFLVNPGSDKVGAAAPAID